MGCGSDDQDTRHTPEVNTTGPEQVFVVPSSRYKLESVRGEERRKETVMPNAYIDGPPLELDTKRQLAAEITDAMEKAFGFPRQAYVVTIKENPAENVCVGGVMICDRTREQQ
jgi:4-oxalocrotonate tautomerase